MFPFLKLIYNDGIIPKFNQFDLLEIDERLLDEKGFIEIYIGPGGNRSNYSRFYAILSTPGHDCYPITFNVEHVAMLENTGETITSSEELTMREQLVVHKIKETDVLFIIQDEQYIPIDDRGCCLRSLKIYSAEKIENNNAYIGSLYEIETRISYYEDQIEELLRLREMLENN